MSMRWMYFWTVLAVVFAAYGVLVRSVGSGTGFFMVWLSLGVVSACCAVAAYFQLWKKIPLPVRVIVLIFLVAAAALFLFVEARIIGCFQAEPEKKVDSLIVPGAQIHESGPSVVLRYRLEKARIYLEEHEETMCIVSGGQGYNEPYPEAVGMKEYLIRQGIGPERILTESESENTKENMIYSQQFFDPEQDRVGIVTNNFHVYRACALARKSGIRHVSGVPADSTALYLPNNMLREFMGVMKDYACGNI